MSYVTLRLTSDEVRAVKSLQRLSRVARQAALERSKQLAARAEMMKKVKVI